MVNTSPVLLILGSGPNIGHHVARAFAAKGYKVALASRKLKEEDSTTDQINISSDLSDPESVVKTFSRVKELLGHPSVVIYNGKHTPNFQKLYRNLIILEAGAVTVNDAKNPLSLPLVSFTRDLNINTTSAFVAAQQAALSFEQLPDSAARTFIYTGNILNTTTMAPLLDLGVGKSATAHIIQSAAAAYKDRGYKYVFLQ
jgi:NAD(P)-dependent dehydrogenase (short-subunit alcohol dehydrogenase family)